MLSEEAQNWHRLNGEVHARCRVYNILRERWRNEETAHEADFFVMDVRDWVLALAMTAAKEVVLVRQFRFGSGSMTWELPAGLVEPDEDTAVACARELLEESGFAGEAPLLLGSVHPNPAIQRNRCHIYLIENAQLVGGTDPDEHESFDVRPTPLAEVRQMVANGTITHSIVLTALYLLDQKA